MTAAAIRRRAGASAADPRLEEIRKALDPGFLALLDWNWERRVITFPRVHPVIGLPDCPVPNCPLAITVATWPMCRGCIERWGGTDLPLEKFRRIPKTSTMGGGQLPSAVAQCERPRDTAAAKLCATHRLQRTQALAGIGMEDFLAHPKVVGLAGLGPCLVAACYLDRVSGKYPYCKAHTQRLRTVREQPAFDEGLWPRTERAVCSTREVSLRGLPDRLVAEALYALSSRVDNGFKLRPECLRPLYDRLHAQQVTRFDEVADPEAAGYSREQIMMIRAARLALSRLNTTPETERVKDVWDMSVFGRAHRRGAVHLDHPEAAAGGDEDLGLRRPAPAAEQERRPPCPRHHLRRRHALGKPAPAAPRPRAGSGRVGAGRHRGVLQPHGPPHRDR
ncbi:hypothetical protein OG592_41165 (plasmid) [Streptomyces avidinii]|uniref:hypothetical protein n=1 Tax=Streptomyces avidinii TaxID=1895 RepID=UPI002F911442|nr:hypothetical protein OG592_41165 [Streptomyces avidinii]